MYILENAIIESETTWKRCIEECFVQWSISNTDLNVVSRLPSIVSRFALHPSQNAFLRTWSSLDAPRLVTSYVPAHLVRGYLLSHAHTHSPVVSVSSPRAILPPRALPTLCRVLLRPSDKDIIHRYMYCELISRCKTRLSLTPLLESYLLNLTTYPMTPMTRNPMPTAWLILMNSRLSAMRENTC